MSEKGNASNNGSKPVIVFRVDLSRNNADHGKTTCEKKKEMSEEGNASDNGCFVVNTNNADHEKTTCGKEKGIQWSKEEHLNFLAGLEKYGKGKWKEISKEFVKGRTSIQVASHAQKYYKFLQNPHKKRKTSAFHVTLNAMNHQESEETPGNKSFFSPSSD